MISLGAFSQTSLSGLRFVKLVDQDVVRLAPAFVGVEFQVLALFWVVFEVFVAIQKHANIVRDCIRHRLE